MKALILAAGQGSRLKREKENRNKCMLRVGGRPILEYKLMDARRLPLDEAVLVVNYKKEGIIDAFGDKYKGLPITYVEQEKISGTVDAIESAIEYIKDEPFYLFLGDEMFFGRRKEGMLERYRLRKEDIMGICGVLRDRNAEQVRNCYSVVTEGRKIKKVIESPGSIPEMTQGTGNCIFDPEILDYITEDLRGLEFPSLVQKTLEDGRNFEAFEISENYVNINRRCHLEKARSLFNKERKF